MQEEQTAYPLWQFRLESLDTDFLKPLHNCHIATRGTLQQAKDLMTMRYKGYRIHPLPYCYINAANDYHKNHAPGWLYRAPVWLSN